MLFDVKRVAGEKERDCIREIAPKDNIWIEKERK
jgi:hypothetical protein